MTNLLKKSAVSIIALLLWIPVAAQINSLPTKMVNGKKYYYYEVQPQETVYSLCKRFNITKEELIRTNPSVEDGLKAYQELLFPVKVKASEPTTMDYEVSAGETAYAISRKFNMPLDQFYALNPTTRDGVKLGQKVKVQVSAAQPTISKATAIVTTSTTTDNSSPAPVFQINNKDSFVIAVALPFMAGEESRNKAAISATEFYKGLLVAIDSIATFGRPIKVLTFDTKGTVEGAKSVISEPSLKSADIIIGPDKADQFQLFADYAKANNINLLNLFLVKDNSYLNNRNVMHANISHADMYNKAVDYYLNINTQATLVILNRTDGAKDKQEFINLLKKKAKSINRHYIELEFAELLESTELKKLPQDTDFAFITTSSKPNELAKVMTALTEYKLTATSQINLLGYPEWLVIRNELLDEMHNMDTYVFSRFYSVKDDIDTYRLNNSFIKWYGSSLIESIPRQGVYGFDTGVFLINALNSNYGNFEQITPPYDGLQNAFNFVRVPGGGWINDEMFILHYTPSNVVFKQGI